MSDQTHCVYFGGLLICEFVQNFSSWGSFSRVSLYTRSAYMWVYFFPSQNVLLWWKRTSL